jgi:hypothetical protein
MTFDQWAEQISKGVCLQSDENLKVPDRIYSSFEEGFEEDESLNSSLEKN